MKLDQQTAQSMLRAAMRVPQAPGKYDVFAWIDGDGLHTITVAWKSFTKRSVALETAVLEEGEEIQTNAGPLPNGMGRNTGRYVGSFRVDRKPDAAGEP
ncbi:MAG: hypothetical protein QM780_15265 [Hyphomicrobium sp.]|uniref:hypothetical protein n=1 Tax=Hyphomicrobium sp. TaxID=82 RepID=UPI0039E6FEF8